MDANKNITVKNIRNANIIKVMYSLIKDGNKTRNVLAKENHISLMTVKHIVDDLVENGILTETVCNDTEIGRKPKILQINNIYGNIVCINLTSKKEITFLIYDIYEQLVDKGSIKIDKNISYKQNICCVIDAVKTRLQNIPSTTVGVAVFVPSAYYEDMDLINYDLIADFKDLHIKSLLNKMFNIDNILVIHDVYSAAKSEYDSLNSTNESQFYFYCGTGIGGFFINNNVPIIGRDLMAGEIGKMIVSEKDNWDKYVILEDIASVEAVSAKMKQHSIDKDFAEIIAMYNEKDEQVQKILKPILDVITKVLYNLLWVYNPDRIIIDSCYKQYSSLIVKHVKAFYEKMQNKAIPINVEIQEAKYNEYHTMRGCFHMVRDNWIKDIAQTNSNK